MENFTAYNPTRLHFGKNCNDNLGLLSASIGSRALLVYGMGSAIKYGYHAKITETIRDAGIEIAEYSGIKSNPVIEDVDNAAQLAIESQSEMIIALGGGSVIDSAKLIAVSAAEKVKGWDIMSGKHIPHRTLPLLTILTLAATGTEMNNAAVLQNNQCEEKKGFKSDLIYPLHSFLDPSFTLTVPADYTAYGIVDLIAHCLEAYFGYGDATLSDRFVYSIIQEAIHYGPQLLKDLQNYDLRAKILWASTCALNNITLYGRTSGDWGVHAIGHVLSLLYDIPHGASLSIVYPAWLKFNREQIDLRLTKLGQAVFNVKDSTETIRRLEDFFVSVMCPVSLSQVNITSSELPAIQRILEKNKASGSNFKLFSDDYPKILGLMS